MLIPVGIIAAWMAVPKKAMDKLLQSDRSSGLPVLVKSVERKNFTANLRSNDDKSQYQLEWINKQASTTPSSLIYKISQPENELVGRVEAKGSYHFNLSRDSTGNYDFILYDIIKKQTIDSLKFPL